jgi:elongation factor 1-beta
LTGDSSKEASFYGPANEAVAAPPAAAAAQGGDDDDIDLFGSDEEEDAEAEKLKAQRLEEYRSDFCQ